MAENDATTSKRGVELGLSLQGAILAWGIALVTVTGVILSRPTEARVEEIIKRELNSAIALQQFTNTALLKNQEDMLRRIDDLSRQIQDSRTQNLTR